MRTLDIRNFRSKTFKVNQIFRNIEIIGFFFPSSSRVFLFRGAISPFKQEPQDKSMHSQSKEECDESTGAPPGGEKCFINTGNSHLNKFCPKESSPFCFTQHVVLVSSALKLKNDPFGQKF